MSTSEVEARKLGRSALVYLIPNLLVRGATFLLTPVYAWTMRPADFAVVGVASTVAGLLSTALGFALHGSITRMHFECPDEPTRRRYYGTVLAFLASVPVALTVLLEVLGRAGRLDVVHTVPFDPYLRLVLWTALLSVYPSIPTALFMAREEPAKVAGLNVAAAAAQIGFTLLFVLGLREGAVGVLRAGVCAAGSTALLSFWVMRRHATPAFDVGRLRHSLLFSIPLVPHLIANWAMSLSDRLVLDRAQVPAAEIGRYSLAYFASFAVGLFAGAVTNALSPIATRLLKEDGNAPQLPALGERALLAIVSVALVVVAFAPEALALATPPAYHAAASFVPWVVLGAVFQGVYLINSIGTWFSMRTLAVPLVTGSTATLNLVLNVVFVPRFGAMAAALSTAVSYFAAAVLHGWIAGRVHPIAWTYRRWGWMIGAASSCAALALLVPPASHRWLSVMVKIGIVLVLFPVLLAAGGIVRRERMAMQLRAVGREVLRRFNARRRSDSTHATADEPPAP